MNLKQIELLLCALDEHVHAWAEHMDAERGPSLCELMKLSSIDQILERLVQRAELCQWGAWSPSAATHWNPLEQSYTAFLKAHVDAEPFLLMRARSHEILMPQLLRLGHGFPAQ